MNILENFIEYIGNDAIMKDDKVKILQCISDCIQEFDFKEVAKIFKFMKYSWKHPYIPTETEIRYFSINLLFDAFKGLINNNGEEFSIASARMKAVAYKGDNSEYSCSLEFIPVWYDNI